METRKLICTVLGHVDHGKSSLLDKIRGTCIIKGEPGAITQAIGASIIPLTLGMDAMRQLIFPSASAFGFVDVSIEILVLIGLCVIFLLAAYLLLRYMEKLSVREGRLTESRR